ncbi:hypothetical protein B484DRAFT_465700 [Ochromonadaceae sp. CCMP2298]|nr:hypothetical protein B484DRAFT_465700 [Ochromonadaceae sp. CCMP2298]
MIWSPFFISLASNCSLEVAVRLGRYRRNVGEYSVHQRRTGMDAEDRMEDSALLNLGMRMGVVAVLLSEDAEHAAYNAVVVAFVWVFKKLFDLRRPRLCTPDAIVPKDIHFQSFTASEYRLMFGMSRDKCEQIVDSMQIPQLVVLNEPGSRHAFSVSDVHAFLYTLFHFHSPSLRMELDQQQWGYDCSVLSKMTCVMEELIDNLHSFRLRCLPEAVERFPEFNAKIRAKLQEGWPFEQLPPHAEQCALFADGSRFRCARPSGPWEGVFGPDSIFVDWFDDPIGKENDKFFMRDSLVYRILRDNQLYDLIQYLVYCDAGYCNDTHVRCAYQGPSSRALH